jgi:hypothetical protein
MAQEWILEEGGPLGGSKIWFKIGQKSSMNWLKKIQIQYVRKTNVKYIPLCDSALMLVLCQNDMAEPAVAVGFPAHPVPVIERIELDHCLRLHSSPHSASSSLRKLLVEVRDAGTCE